MLPLSVRAWVKELGQRFDQLTDKAKAKCNELAAKVDRKVSELKKPTSSQVSDDVSVGSETANTEENISSVLAVDHTASLDLATPITIIDESEGIVSATKLEEQSEDVMVSDASSAQPEAIPEVVNESAAHKTTSQKRGLWKIFCDCLAAFFRLFGCYSRNVQPDQENGLKEEPLNDTTVSCVDADTTATTSGDVVVEVEAVVTSPDVAEESTAEDPNQFNRTMLKGFYIGVFQSIFDSGEQVLHMLRLFLPNLENATIQMVDNTKFQIVFPQAQSTVIRLPSTLACGPISTLTLALAKTVELTIDVKSRSVGLKGLEAGLGCIKRPIKELKCTDKGIVVRYQGVFSSSTTDPFSKSHLVSVLQMNP